MTLTEQTAVKMIPFARKLGWLAQNKYGMDQEDVQQQTLMRLLEQGLADDCDNPVLYATVIMRSAVMTEVERKCALKRSMVVQMKDGHDAEDESREIDPIRERKLKEVLASVSIEDAGMFRAVYLMGFSRADVAAVTGRKIHNVTKRIDAVVNKVAEKFEYEIPRRRKDESGSVYTFKSESGDEFTGSRVEFSNYSGLPSGSIGALVKHGAAQRGGWRLVK